MRTELTMKYIAIPAINYETKNYEFNYPTKEITTKAS